MKHETLYKIEEKLCKELDEYGKVDDLSDSDYKLLDTILHATKNLYKIMDYSDEGEGSYRMNDGNSSYYSRRGSSYGRSYADGRSYRGMSHDSGSYRRGRDSMGRFVSRSGGDMIERLKAMRDETDDDNEREELDSFIRSIEHRG